MTDLDPNQIAIVEAEIQKLGERVWTHARGETPGLFDLEFWQGRLLDWAMRDPDFKVDMFRFVDVLPSLHGSDPIALHIREYLLKKGRKLPSALGLALKAASSGLMVGLASKAIRQNVEEMARKFIIGQDSASAFPNLYKLHKAGIAFTLDILGEKTTDEAQAQNVQQHYLRLIDETAETVNKWPKDDIIDQSPWGPIPRANISIKLSALDPMLDSADPGGAVKRLTAKVMPILLKAKEKNVFINVDVEQWEYHAITFKLFSAIALTSELLHWPHLGIVIQAYLKHAEIDLRNVLDLAQNRGTPLTVRLVKGAYWDHEMVHARQSGATCPVFQNKVETDANYEHLSLLLLHNYQDLHPAFGSHNLRSLLHAIAQARMLKIPDRAYELQMLYGMAEPIRKSLRAQGQRLRVYAPLGELLPGMSYLVRRLLENTSNQGFLRLSYHDNVNITELLNSPQAAAKINAASSAKSGSSDKSSGSEKLFKENIRRPLASTQKNLNLTDFSAFSNCPFADFTDESVHLNFKHAIAETKNSLPLLVPIILNGQAIEPAETILRFAPSDTQLLVAKVSCATVELTEQAIQIATQAWPEWRDKSILSRAKLLEALGEKLQEDRWELAALQMFEVGKPWREADAEVAEAVDFCRYYARQALQELSPTVQGNIAGEINTLYYEGRGVTAIIAPWNFPLAILCGMSAAALVAGNTIVMKPAEQSSAIASALFQRMLDVGIPPEVVQFLPGPGETIGRHLVNHAGIAQIAFTGSRKVGFEIIAQAAQMQPTQTQIKRVICEMGGKNAIIVDQDADLDEAVMGIIKSTFGFAGQKCSACSRLIVVAEIFETLLNRLIEATKLLHPMPADLPACQLGPVIDEESFWRLKKLLALQLEGAKLIFSGQILENGGWFIAPTIFVVESAQHPLMLEEFFGPILSVLKVDNFTAAVQAALASEYALTGAVYSRTPSHLEQARHSFRVGNLYLNRGCTGAMVDRQPFGGLAHSGTGIKAGGPYYLKLFADMRCVTENTMRSGFTPDLTI